MPIDAVLKLCTGWMNSAALAPCRTSSLRDQVGSESWTVRAGQSTSSIWSNFLFIFYLVIAPGLGPYRRASVFATAAAHFLLATWTIRISRAPRISLTTIADVVGPQHILSFHILQLFYQQKGDILEWFVLLLVSAHLKSGGILLPRAWTSTRRRKFPQLGVCWTIEPFHFLRVWPRFLFGWRPFSLWSKLIRGSPSSTVWTCVCVRLSVCVACLPCAP